jgi:hypothetical protein
MLLFDKKEAYVLKISLFLSAKQKVGKLAPIDSSLHSRLLLAL